MRCADRESNPSHLRGRRSFYDYAITQMAKWSAENEGDYMLLFKFLHKLGFHSILDSGGKNIKRRGLYTMWYVPGRKPQTRAIPIISNRFAEKIELKKQKVKNLTQVQRVEYI